MSDESFGTITSLKVVANYENNSRVNSKTLLYRILLYIYLYNNILRITLLTERNIYCIHNYITYIFLYIFVLLIFYSMFS